MYLTADSITCYRNKQKVLDNLSFTLNSGDFMLVTGNNGSGKSTLLRCLCNLCPIENGEIRFDNRMRSDEIEDEFKNRILYLGHKNCINDDLTCAENLKFLFYIDCYDSGTSKDKFKDFDSKKILSALGLSEYSNRKVSTLSEGTKKKLSLLRLWSPRNNAIESNNKSIWLLDEPLNSLDTESKKIILKKMLSHTEYGGIIVCASHIELPDEFKFLITKNIDLSK